MPFLSPNQQRQSTEGTIFLNNNKVIKYLQAGEIVESSETQPETPYDRLGPVRPRPTQPPVYLQLVDSSAQAVVEQSGDSPVTSDRDVEKRGPVSASSQAISGEEQPATDIVQ